MHHRRSAARTALLLAGLGTLTGAAACGAPAQELPAWDAVTATRSGLWDTVPVTLTWSLDGAAGSTGFTVELPPELRPLDPVADAVAPDGTLVGQVEIDGEQAHVTWETAQQGRATAELAMAWDPAEVGAGEDVELMFRAGPQEVGQHVRIREDVANLSDGRLYGYWTDRENEDRLDPHGALQWRYVTPVGTAKPTHLTVDAGQEISCDAIALRALVDGDEGREIVSRDAPEVTCSSREVEVTLRPRTPDEALMLLVPATPVLASDSYAADVDVTPDPLTSTVDRAAAAEAAPVGSAAIPDTGAVVATIAAALAASTALAVIVLLAARRRGPASRT